MSTRASIILWSAGSGILLGLFIDALLVGVWIVASSVMPAIAPRNFSKWSALAALLVLTAIPLAAGLLGYLEGRLKLN